MWKLSYIKNIHNFSSIHVKVSTSYITALDKTILQCIWNPKSHGIIKSPKLNQTHRKHHNTRFLAIPQSCNNTNTIVLAQADARSQVPTSIWFWEKGPKSTSWWKQSLLNKLCWNIKRTFTFRRMKSYSYFLSHTKIKFKCINCLYKKLGNLQVVKNSMRHTWNHRQRQNFLNMTLRAQESILRFKKCVKL